MVSPCRSGSTVMLRVFGHAGCMAYFQPIKNALRWRELGAERPWQPPAGSIVFIKETFGPFAPFETGFDPLAELVSAGLASDRLFLVVLLRDPGMVWASWRNLWPKTSDMTLLARAYHACLACVATANQLGVRGTSLNYEACADDPTRLLGGLFAKVGLGAADGALHGWPDRPGFGAPGSGVFLPQEPEPYITPGAHRPVIESKAFCRMPLQAIPTQAEHARIAATDIPRSYARLAAWGAGG